MATYKNKSAAAHVHAGKVVPPGGTFDAQPTKNLGKLVKAEVLELASGGSADKAAGAGADGSDDKAPLVVRAKELGIAGVGAHWGVDKLKEAIADAEKAPGAGAGGSGQDA